MTSVAVLSPRHTVSRLFQARANEYPRLLLLMAGLLALAPVLHVSTTEDNGNDPSPLPFLGGIGATSLDNVYWLGLVAAMVLMSVRHYRKHGIQLRGMAFTAAVAVAAYVFVAVVPGAVWHWRYLALVALATVVWGLVIAERSWWLGIVAVAFSAVSVVSGTTNTALYQDMGLFTEYSRTAFLIRDLLLPVLVLLIGGLAGLLVRRSIGDQPATDAPALVLLKDLARLHRPADARRYAPPLLVFGVLIIAAVPLYQTVEPDYSHRIDLMWHQELVDGFGGLRGWLAHPLLIDLYWLAVDVLGIGFAGWWYRARAARLGIELDTRGQLVAAGATLLGVVVGVPVVTSVTGGYYGFLDPYLHAWLLVLSTVAAATLLVRAAVGERRILELVVGLLLAAFAVAMLALYLSYWALMPIAAVVFAMAWAERSRWLGLVAAAFATAVVLTSVTDNSLLRVIGWGADDNLRLNVLQDMLLPAAVLLIGGIAGLAARRGAARNRIEDADV